MDKEKVEGYHKWSQSIHKQRDTKEAAQYGNS